MISQIKSECWVDGCKKPSKSRGLCDMHYARWLRYGRLERFNADYTKIKHCIAFDCKRPIDKGGLCSTHYSNLKRVGSPYLPKVIKLCSVEGCDAVHLAKGLCSRHYRLWRIEVEKNGLEHHMVGIRANE